MISHLFKWGYCMEMTERQCDTTTEGRRQITVTIDTELLRKLDALSHELRQSRSAVIGMAVYQAVHIGLRIKG